MKLTISCVLCALSVVAVACTESAQGSKKPEQITTAPPLTDRRAMSEKLCKVLNEIAPQAPQLAAVGTQAQLVMSIASAFDANAEALRQVADEIDTVAAASCPSARDALLKVLKMQSLQEAVR